MLTSRLPPWSTAAGLAFNRPTLKPLHLNSLQHYQEDHYNAEEEEKEKKRNVLKRQDPYNNNVHHHAETDRMDFQRVKSRTARQPTSDDNEKQRKHCLYGVLDGNHQNGHHHHHDRHGKEQRSTHRHLQEQRQHKSSAIVVPQNRITTRSHQAAERMKDSRLNGADLYVARLGYAGKADPSHCSCLPDISRVMDEAQVNDKDSEQRATDLEMSSKMKPLTGSLHEELRFPSPSKASRPTPQSVSKDKRPTATHSRPCYRCISYMHSAGIKRVFWTNHMGVWEGGKVRELVDALEGPMSPNGNAPTGAPSIGSVYVTKSEVLLLKGLI